MLRLLTLILIAATCGISVRSETNSIEWQKDFKKAQSYARETGKPLLLDFTASWCKPCLMMDREFWVLQDVVESVKPFVTVKIDYDKDRAIAERYGVAAIPFVAFTDPLGNLVTFRKGFGSKNVRELNQIFDEMPKDFSALLPLYDAVDKNKNDGNALAKIGDSYRAAKMIRLSCQFYARALRSDSIKQNFDEKERVAATLAVNLFSIKDYQAASDPLNDYVKEFQTGKNRETILFAAVLTNSYLDKPKDAVKFFHLLQAEYPNSKSLTAAQKAIEDSKIRKESKK